LTDFSCGSWDTQLERRVVARPCKVSWEIDFSLVCVHGPFAAQRAKGEEEYPYRWLGGTSEVFTVKSGEMDGAQAR
jgi:hypothetical protein